MSLIVWIATLLIHTKRPGLLWYSIFLYLSIHTSSCVSESTTSSIQTTDFVSAFFAICRIITQVAVNSKRSSPKLQWIGEELVFRGRVAFRSSSCWRKAGVLGGSVDMAMAALRVSQTVSDRATAAASTSVSSTPLCRIKVRHLLAWSAMARRKWSLVGERFRAISPEFL